VDFDWTPTEDRVVVSPIEDPDATPGGILLPTQAKEKPNRGTVVAVGPGRLLDSGERAPIPFGVGAEILYGKYSGMDFKLPGYDKPLLVMRAGEVSLFRPAQA
jgi:chaperonin GroES